MALQPPPPPQLGPADEQVDPVASGILRFHFGKNWRWWKRFKQQWNPTTILTLIGAVATSIVTLGTYALIEHTHVVIFETRMEPVLQGAKTESDNSLRLDHVESRVTRIERNIDVEYNEALRAYEEAVRDALRHGAPPPPRPKELGDEPTRKRNR